ncbi:unnamed protein product [Rhizopus stolonifer]
MARSDPNGESKRDWTVEKITQIGRDILGDDNRLYAETTQLIPGVRSYTEKNHSIHQEKKKRDYDYKPKDRVRKPETPYFCSYHGRNRIHESKDCFTLKNKKPKGVAKDLNSCRRCDKPYGPGHISPVLAVAKDATEKDSILEQVDNNIDSQMEDIHFDCKDLEKRIKANNAFNLLTSIIIENQKVIGMVDTGSSCTFINLHSLNNKLNIKHANKSKGSYSFLSKESGVSRIGLTDSLTFKYSNNITFKHSLEVMGFNENFEFDILLGSDILPKMNIGITGFAYSFEGDHTHSDNTIDPNVIFESLNIDKENKFEPDNSPAGTPEQRAGFLKAIQSSLEINKNIPVSSSCPLPESIVHLPTKEGSTAYRRQYPITHA